MSPEQVRYVLQLEDAICCADRELRICTGSGIADLGLVSQHEATLRAVVDGRDRRHAQIDAGEIVIP